MQKVTENTTTAKNFAEQIFNFCPSLLQHYSLDGQSYILVAKGRDLRLYMNCETKFVFVIERRKYKLNGAWYYAYFINKYNASQTFNSADEFLTFYSNKCTIINQDLINCVFNPNLSKEEEEVVVQNADILPQNNNCSEIVTVPAQAEANVEDVKDVEDVVEEEENIVDLVFLRNDSKETLNSAKFLLHNHITKFNKVVPSFDYKSILKKEKYILIAERITDNQTTLLYKKEHEETNLDRMIKVELWFDKVFVDYVRWQDWSDSLEDYISNEIKASQVLL